MSSLRALVAAHAPLLVLDAASSRIQVGWIDAPAAATDAPGRPAHWIASDAESGTALFEAIAQLGVCATAAGAFVFCHGPGSVLGIRTAAMAIRTWCVLQPRPVFAYSSLALVAAALDRPGVTVIADARREAWHCFAAGGPLRRVATAALTEPLIMPAGFRHWSALPGNVGTAPYRVGELLAATSEADLFSVTDAPDAFLHEEPSYVTWTPRIHRAPESRGGQNV
jgi:tRNA threonylcarbamoyladenosine biosynthesis protein TsaB